MNITVLRMYNFIKHCLTINMYNGKFIPTKQSTFAKCWEKYNSFETVIQLLYCVKTVYI